MSRRRATGIVGCVTMGWLLAAAGTAQANPPSAEAGDAAWNPIVWASAATTATWDIVTTPFASWSTAAAAAVPVTGAATPAAPAPAESGTWFGTIFDTLWHGWELTSYYIGVAFNTVTPPTPAAMARSLREDRQADLFRLLGYTGYKLKEIENGIGLPPTISFKFLRVRDLSEADIDFVERELSRWQRRDPGLIGEAQRSIIYAILTINSATELPVESVTIKALPLPQIKFTMVPDGLSVEGGILFRAIQRVERRLAQGASGG